MARSLFKEKLKKEIGDNLRDLFEEKYQVKMNDFSAYRAAQKIKIPVLITYGTKDWNAPYNDLLQIESIQSNLKNLTFKPYFDLEHNFFPVNENREPNYEVYNWENVGKDWKNWLNKN